MTEKKHASETKHKLALEAIKKGDFTAFLNNPVVFNSIEFIVNRYAYNYAMPEIDKYDEELEDYKSSLKTAYIYGMRGVFEKCVVKDFSTRTFNECMAYMSINAKHYMLYDETLGVLGYMKEIYPECTEYYLRQLVKVHKSGVKGFICEQDPAELAAKTNLTPLAVSNLQSVFTPTAVESLSVIGQKIFKEGNNSYLLNEKMRVNDDACMQRIRETLKRSLSEEEVEQVIGWAEGGIPTGSTILKNKAKKALKSF